jgi:zinc protease
VGQLLVRPRHAPEDFEREKALQIQELQQGPDDPSWIAGRAFRALLHGSDHPYGLPASGYVESVKNISLDDVKAFHRTRYASSGAKVIIVGDVDPDSVVETLESSLKGWNNQGPAVVARPPETVKPEPGVVYLIDKPGAVQTIVRVGRRWVGRNDPRYLASLLGNRIFGGDFLSRVNQNLREKNGFTYGASSSFRYLRDRGTWELGTDVRADATGPALKELLGELDGVCGPRPLTEEEIAVNRAALLRAFSEDFEAPGSIVGELTEVAEFHLPLDEWSTYSDRLSSAPNAAVRKTMAEAADANARLVLVVGDRRSIEPMIRALGVRDIRVLTPEGKPSP